MPVPIALSQGELTILGRVARTSQAARILVTAMDRRTQCGLTYATVRRAYMAVRIDGGTDMVPGLEKCVHLRSKLATLFHAAGCYAQGRIQYKRPAGGTKDTVVVLRLSKAPTAADELLAARTFPQSWEPYAGSAHKDGTVWTYEDKRGWFLYYQ